MSRHGPRRTLAAAVLAGALLATTTPGAGAAVNTITLRYGPIKVAPYSVLYNGNAIPAPDVDGYITKMHARIVDAAGHPIQVQRMMLHHAVFINRGRFTGDRTDPSYCHSNGERFYGTGEENATLTLPPGYGYPIRKGDRWRLGWMMMNHQAKTDSAYIRYTMRVVTGEQLTPVKSYWIGVIPCHSDPIFNVPGGAAPNTTFERTRPWIAPVSGRIVAASGHIHGGAKAIKLTQPACGDRLIVRSAPLFGLPSNPYYHVLPVLHEPGPIRTTWDLSQTGVPITQGERLEAHALYDAHDLHTRVMGIMHIYVAPPAPTKVTQPGANAGVATLDGPPGGGACAPLPSDLHEYMPPLAGRRVSPYWKVPLTGLDARGRAVTINAPAGPLTRLPGNGTVNIAQYSFSQRNISIPAGARLRWSFLDAALHNVTLANGPTGFGSLPYRKGGAFSFRFTIPGTYRLFCSLHPVLMTERVIVRSGGVGGGPPPTPGAGSSAGVTSRHHFDTALAW